MTNDTVPLGLSLFRSVSRTEGLTVDVHDRRPDRDATVVRIAHHLVVGLGPQIDLDADTASALADELRRAVRAARKRTPR